jgi:hypothetical protein
MYRIPKDLDLSPVMGRYTTQLRIGSADLQFTFDNGSGLPGAVNFAVWSVVGLFRAGRLLAHWEAGKWPDPGFYEILNIEVIRWEVPNDRLIVLEFANGIEMHLEDDSDQYESMGISFEGNPTLVII